MTRTVYLDKNTIITEGGYHAVPYSRTIAISIGNLTESLAYKLLKYWYVTATIVAYWWVFSK